MMKALQTLLVLTILAPWCVVGYSSFQSLIPNGNAVRDPCDQVTLWAGVGHQAMGGSGPRNPFGVDFNNNGKVWNRTLCEKDSDGDGASNGAELGDPDCSWTPGTTPSGPPTGHPGLCEPWSDPVCLLANTFHTCQTQDFQCDPINSPDVMDFAVRFPPTAVPADETTYMCMNFALPSDRDYHVIADRGLIDNEYVMHHLLIYGCPKEVELSDLVNDLNTPYPCGMAGEVRCQEIIALWSVGIPGFCHNENAGFRIGPSGYRYASMQMHWNNPMKKADYTDSSGMTLFYTPILRPHNLGNLMTGESFFHIPPGENRYIVESHCSSTCSNRIMNGSVNVVAGLNHMHYMGREMATLYTPVGGAEQVIMHDPHFSYDNPEVHTFSPPIVINPGDVIRTTCSFTSLHKDTTIFSGEATSQEMCFGFLFYYPKEAIRSRQCTTSMGLPVCSLHHDTDMIDGCQVESFIRNQTYFTELFGELSRRCDTSFCRKECKTYLKEERKNPCFQGRVGKYVDRVLGIYVGVNEMARYHSCSVELALEEVEPCTCTSPRPCVEYTGAGVSLRMSFVVLLLSMAHTFFM